MSLSRDETEAANDNFKWPKLESERALLIIPKKYDDPYSQPKVDKHCKLDYDSDRGLLLVCDENDDVLDVMNIKDIIGASIQVQLNDSNDESSPRSASSSNTTTSNGSSANNEPISELPVDTQASAVLEIYVYPRKDVSKGKMKHILSSCGFGGGKKSKSKLLDEAIANTKAPLKLGSRYACHRQFQIAPAEDLKDITTVVRAIRNLASGSSKNNKLLVIVNPISGKRLGKHIYDTTLRPMLDEAGYDHDLFLTEYAGHATTITQTTDITKYDGIVAVGGDGVLHEVFQSLKEEGMNAVVLSKLKIGHIGAGTSNGYSKSLTFACNERDTAIDYCFQVAKGQTVKMDISKYQTSTNEYYSFLTFSWGMIADIDIESEVIRFVGNIRMDIWGVWKVLQFRTYKAKFSYLPAAAPADPPSSGGTFKKIPSLKESLQTTTKENSTSTENWVTEETDFVLFWASHVTHAAEKTYHSPPTKLPAEGLFTIFLVR